MFKKLFSGHVATIVFLYVVLLLFLGFLNPYNLPAPLLLVPFILFFAATALLLYRLIGFINKKLGLSLSKGRAARLGIMCSGLPTFLVLLQSIGQVGGYDIIVSVVLFVAIDFYLARSRFGLFRRTDS